MIAPSMPGAALLPFKPGFVLIARRARAPIQLVRITTDSDVLTKGRAWWRLPKFPAHIEVSAGPLIAPDTAARPGERIRVGFASAHLHTHSVSKTHGGWITALDRSRFAVFGYQFSEARDAVSGVSLRAVDNAPIASNSVVSDQCSSSPPPQNITS